MDRDRKRPTRRDLVNVPRAINIDQGRSQAWGNVANQAFRLSMQVHDELDNEARVDGWRQGFSGDLNDPLMFSPTIRGEAFTKQAVQSFWTNLEAQSRVRAMELEAEYSSDPAGMEGAFKTYAESVVSTLPQEFQGKATAYLTTMAAPRVAQARSALVKRKTAQAEANMVLAERTALLEIERSAGGLMSSDPNVSQASANAIAAIRAKLGAMYSSTVEDDKGNKHPVFSPKAKAEASLQLEEIISRTALMGWYEQAPNKLGALRVAAAGGVKVPMVDDKGNTIGVFDPMANLDMKQRKALIRDMRSEFSAQLSIQRSLAAMSDRSERKRNQSALVQLYQQHAQLGSTGVTSINARKLLASTTDPTIAKQAFEIINRGGNIGDPKNTMQYLQGKLLAMQGQFEVDNYRHVQGLDPATIVSLVGDNQSGADRLRNMSPTTAAGYRDARSLISGHLAGMSYEAAVAAQQAGRDSPELRKALQYEVLLLEAVLNDPSVDPVSWVQKNVTGVMQGKADAIRTMTTDLRDAESALKERRTWLRTNRRGVNLRDDPTYKQLYDQVGDLRGKIDKAMQQ